MGIINKTGVRWLRGVLGTGKELLACTLSDKRRPVFVGVDVTHRCNLSCKYCVRGPLINGEEMDERRVLAVMTQLSDAGMRVVSIGGGEPLLRPDLPRILELLTGRGVLVSLSSNGTLLAGRTDVLHSIDRLKVSVDGPEYVHDAFRGKGVFKLAMKGINTARTCGIPVMINCTLTAAGVKHLEQTLELAGREGLRIKYQPVSTAHAGDADIRDARPDIDGYRKAVETLLLEKRSGNHLIANSTASLEYLVSWPAGRRFSRCVAGRFYARVRPEGMLYPCSMLQYSVSGEHLPSADIEASMHSIARDGCSACWCTSTLELNLLYNGLFSGLFERGSMLRK